jgi:hypothetical protein
MLEHGLDDVATYNLANEVGNPLNTQEAIVETLTKLTGLQVIELFLTHKKLRQESKSHII